MPGGVLAQVLGGPDAVRAGGEDGALPGEQAGDVPGGDADGGVIDAEDGGDVLAGHAEAVAVYRGQQVGGQAELEGGGGAFVPAAAGTAAGQVQALLAVGGVGQFEGGGQGVEGGAGHAGQGGVREGVQVRPGRGRGRCGRRGGPRDGQDGVVPFAVELVAG